MFSLPTEVILEVFKNMGWRDILHASQTCRTFFELSQDRSIWIHLLRDDSPTLLYRPILEAPIAEYTTQDLKNMVLRNISNTLGWNSPRKPHERITPKGNFPTGIGDAEKVLLEGGRWLLTFGRHLRNYNPDYHRALLAYDLDSPRFSSTIIYKDASPEHNMVDMHAQVDRSKGYLAFTVGLVFQDHARTIKRLDVLSIEQRGRGPEAKLVTSTIKSLQCGPIFDMVGDCVIKRNPVLNNDFTFLDWRNSSSTNHLESTLRLKTKLAMPVQALPENKVLAFEDCNTMAIYRIPEFHSIKPSEDATPVDRSLQQPIWSASLYSQVQDYSTIWLSRPLYGSFVTRLVITHDVRIYGLVIPHNGRTPALHVLGMVPAFSDLSSAIVNVCIDKIYIEPKKPGLKASMLAFSWPDDADLVQPTTWVPPVLHFTHKQFAGHHTSVWRDYDLVDEISGRVVIGSKSRGFNQAPVDGVEWSDIISWSVVDFFHPRFLPSSSET